MKEDELLLIARFDTAFEAEEAKLVLDDGEIESMISDETVGDIGLPGGATAGGVKLYVLAADAPRAIAALAETPARKDLVVEVEEEDEEKERPSPAPDEAE